ncbi:MAG: hypothetical protein IT385_14685 [Deltaproteobacteria bacterium]|nr:hypothetical protein [Deltaproteobacteria bacterium]
MRCGSFLLVLFAACGAADGRGSSEDDVDVGDPDQVPDADPDGDSAPLDVPLHEDLPDATAEPVDALDSRDTLDPVDLALDDGDSVDAGDDVPDVIGCRAVWRAFAPEARSGHTAIYDAANQRMLAFGGTARSDVWALGLAVGERSSWTELAVTGETPEPRSGHTAIYDAARERMIVFGGVGRSDLWELALPVDGEPAWRRLSASGTPPSRPFASAIYDPPRERMIVFGGNGERSGEVWALSLGAGGLVWSPLAPGGTAPEPRSHHSAIYDPARQHMVVFGGIGQTHFDDVHSLSLEGAELAWERLDTGAGPSARVGHSAVYDPLARRMIVFGGAEGSHIGDPWALSLPDEGDPRWESLAIAPAPVERLGHTAIVDPAGARMVVFGGYDGKASLGDAWALSLDAASTPTWADLTPTPGARAGHSAIHDRANDRVIVFGGASYASSTTTYRHDVWELPLDAAADAWRELQPTGEGPLARKGHAAIYDAGNDEMLVFGGDTPSGIVNDLWAMSLSGAPAWRSVSTIGTPPSLRSNHRAIYDQANERMIVYGGLDDPSAWALSLDGEDPEWTQLAALGATWRWGHGAIYDEVGRRMIVHAGHFGDPLDDLWALSLDVGLTPVWSPIATTGAAPGPRGFHAAVHDGVGQRMLVFAGIDYVTPVMNDLWSLSLPASGPRVWTRIAPTGRSPAARWEAAMVFDGARRRAIVVGGKGEVGRTLDDVWELTLPDCR